MTAGRDLKGEHEHRAKEAGKRILGCRQSMGKGSVVGPSWWTGESEGRCVAGDRVGGAGWFGLLQVTSGALLSS